jgi:hypothetical protein
MNKEERMIRDIIEKFHFYDENGDIKINFKRFAKLLSVVMAAQEVCKDHDLLCEDSNNTLCKLNDALIDLENDVNGDVHD